MMAANDIRIIFNTFGSIDLPDGSCLGVQGEHNVARLAITLPESMVVGMTYHTITINGVESAWITTTANNDGAYRDGNVLYVPLTCDMTQYTTVDLFVTAYRQEGAAVSLVDRTTMVRGLQFVYSNSKPSKVKPGGLVAKVYALEKKVEELEDAGVEVVQTLPDDPDDDKIVYLNADDSGFYRWDGSDWVRLTDDGEGLEALANIVSSLYGKVDKIAVAEKYSDLGDSEYDDAFVAFVYGLDGTTDKRGVYVKTDGEWIDPYRTDDSDDVTLLEFKNYASLVVRDDVINSDGIQDVPVYTGGVEEICRLTAGTDYIALQEVRNEISETVSGMPVRVLNVRLGGTSFYYVGAPLLLSDGTTVSKGWRNGNAPVIADFSPTSFSVNNTTYTASDTLPDDALSALRSLSQCVNVSADAMGTIRIPDDAVVRFAGNVEPNRKYYFSAIFGSEISFTLPTVPFTTDDAQFVIYLKCENYVDLVFPNGTKFVGGTLPNSDAGNHKLIGCWLKDAGAWALGGIDYEEAT